jgi:hypothetical protein
MTVLGTPTDLSRYFRVYSQLQIFNYLGTADDFRVYLEYRVKTVPVVLEENKRKHILKRKYLYPHTF